MKLFIISDFHFGKYSMDSDRWLNNMRDYFYEFLMPMLKQYSKPGDKLIVLGDIFDNRNSINLKVISTVVKLFEDLALIMECHVLLGNHDQWAMNNPEINSVCTIRNIKNVIVYEEPTIVDFNGRSALMMPWVHGKDTEKEILDKYGRRYLLFCHSDLNGCRTQLNPTRPSNKNVLDIDDFGGYDRVYSGHIHIVQTIKNFTFVGSPYHLDRNDIDNTKGVFVYDTKKDKDVFIPNDYSPEFKKVKITVEKDLDLLTDDELKKHYVDIEVSTNLMVNAPHARLKLDRVCNKHKIEKIEFIDDVVDEERSAVRPDNYTKDKSMKEISTEWASRLKLNIDLDLFTEIEFRERMNETIDKCFTVLEANKK